ncbi:MAG: PorT family protein [Prevotella sp.]|nr:PorT family protein [Prevotella sp.]
MGKLKWFIIVVAMMFASTADAKLKVGVKGGVDLTKMSFSDDVFNAENRTGWFFGPTLKFTTFTGLGFDIAGLYNHREAQIDVLVADNTKANTLKTKQIIVPLNVRYTLGLGDAVNVFAFAGPQVAFNVGDTEHRLDNQNDDEGLVWRLKESNFSVNAGVGITLANIQVTANYNVGLGKTGDVTWSNATGAIVDGYKGNYTSWQIGLAYFF